ncbi:hypothetical protein TIFTF001_007313 [Ficus carica]|uniref:glutathione transferase n=1 Tax=Ficus carica TaxID=3494 RepID=A0AA88D1W9_FICCA|nr:hypothetical protein TIFTF001_007313 [Ficus carica]
MATIKVHGLPISGATRTVLVCLYEKDLDFELVPVSMSTGAHKQEPFLSLNPFGQIPAVEIGDLQLFENKGLELQSEGKKFSVEKPESLIVTIVGDNTGISRRIFRGRTDVFYIFKTCLLCHVLTCDITV